MLSDRYLSEAHEADEVYANYSGDDEVYGDYVATTIDPGETLLYIALILCAGSLVLLPLCVKFGKYLAKPKYHGQDLESDFDVYEGGANTQLIPGKITCIQRWKKASSRVTLFVLQNGARIGAKRRRSGRHRIGNRRMITASQGVQNEAATTPFAYEQCGACNCIEDDDISLSESLAELAMDISHDLWGDPTLPVYNPPKHPCGVKNQTQTSDQLETLKIPICSLAYLRKKALFMWTIIKYDNETKRILRLVVPFTLSAVTDTIADLIVLAMVSQALGINSVVSWIMVETILGISSSLTYGPISAITSLGSMAYGAGNYELVGQYVKAGCMLYVLFEIPLALICGSQVGNIMLLMGFDESAAVLSESYVWIQIAINLVGGVSGAFLELLELAEREQFASVVYCLDSVIYIGLMWYLTAGGADLIMLGYALLASETVFAIISISIPAWMGWFKYFKLCSFNFADVSVMKTLFKTAVPLSLGSLLAYAEWEILIVFAAILGPAEATTWAILGFVWGVFESTTEAIGSASEVRCAYQLGKGRPALAKLSSYKSMFMAMVMSILVSTALLCFSSPITAWLTQDPTIEAMLNELLPFIAVGNITMNMGMVCWALIGAQGRYRLATSIATVCSFLVTLPIGALMTLYLRINLQGLVFAVVVGYSTVAMVLTFVLLMSDWEKLSTKIRTKMAADDDTESSYASAQEEQTQREIPCTETLSNVPTTVEIPNDEPNCNFVCISYIGGSS